MADAPSSSIATRLGWMADKVGKDELRIFGALMWAAWSCGNMYLFEQTLPDATQLAAGYCRLVEEYRDYAKRVFPGGVGSVGCGSNGYWSPPALGWVKVNVDAHVREGVYVELGAVLRDHEGLVKAMAARKTRARWSSEVAETAAAVFGLRIAQEMGYRQVHLETDAMGVATRIKQGCQGYAIHL
ncbi:hypothetical protein RDABS01_037513 [Bienertia sinuspersici]